MRVSHLAKGWKLPTAAPTGDLCELSCPLSLHRQLDKSLLLDGVLKEFLTDPFTLTVATNSMIPAASLTFSLGPISLLEWIKVQQFSANWMLKYTLDYKIVMILMFFFLS